MTDPLRDKLDQAADRAEAASQAFYNVLTFDRETPVPVEGGTIESMSKRIHDQVGASIDAIEEKANQATQAAQVAEDAKSSAQADATAAGEAKDDAEAAQSASATSATQAQASATAASSSASAAQNSANSASDSASAASASVSDVVAAKDAAVAAKDQAQASAAAAGTSAANAVNSATNASTAASSAATSETNAKGYSDSAMAYRNEAEDHATDSEASATAASGSASAASVSANYAQTSANSAQSSAATASTAASDATAAKNEAVDAKIQAQAASSSAQSYASSAVNSATNALASENAAAASEANALAYANQAKEDAESSDVNASAAQVSANSAAISESNAATSATNAAISEANAEDSASAAQAAAIDAGQSKVDAAGYADAAASSEINAKNAESNAEDYAESALNSAQDAQAIKDSFAEFDGDIQPDASWVAVPAHKDNALNAQAQALANRTELLNKRTEGILNVRAFIDTPIDGVTSNQEGVEAAVAEAYTAGAELEWPAGVYVSDGNIPNFWDVTHKGKGVIKRGSTTFMITGGRTNIKNVYLSPSGSADNDGLTVDFPLLSIQKPFDALADMGSVRGRWVFNLASGTYTKGGILSGKRQLGYRITVKGPEVPLNETPLAIFDGATREAVNGLFFDGCADLELRDIKFINFDSQPSVSAGLVAANTGVVRLINVHCDQCGVGYYARSHTIYFVTGGRVTNCDMGILELFGVVRNFKNVTNIADGFKVANCTYGVFAKEHCTGHLDFSTITDNVYGIFFSRSCTANASDSVIKRNQYGAVLRSGSYMVPLRIDWGLNTPDANTVAPWLADASSGFAVNENDVKATNASGVVGFKNLGDKQIGSLVPTTPITVTGTTAYTSTTFANIQQGSMSTAGLRFRVSVFGSRDTATGAANLELRVGGVGGLTVPLPVAAGAFRAEFDVIATAKDVQTVSGQAFVNGASIASVGRAARTIPFSTADYPLAIRLTHTASDDSSRIDCAFAYSNEPMKSDT